MNPVVEYPRLLNGLPGLIDLRLGLRGQPDVLVCQLFGSGQVGRGTANLFE